MEIPMNVPVTCEGKVCGRSTYVVVNPVTKEMTHFVVREIERPHTEQMVPLAYVDESNHDGITLTVNRAQFHQLEPFEQTEYVKVQVPHYEDSGFAWSYVTTSYKTVLSPVRHPNISLHSRDVHKGAQVVATDGAIGHIEEFIIEPDTHQVTHIVLAEGHLWNERDIVIPVTVIKDFDEERVKLTIDKAAVEALPAVPVHRHVTAVTS